MLDALDRARLASAAVPTRSARHPMVGAELDQDSILAHVAFDQPVRFKPVGSTSIVYEMLLDGPVRAAFKPNSRHRPRGAESEVAAYRIARLLGMDNVPPAVIRRVPREQLAERLHPDFADAWDEIVEWTLFDADGACSGAAIYWVPQMRSLGVDGDARLARFRRHLSQDGEIAERDAPLHADFAMMVAFDYLIGNWDRWSGGNAQGLPDGRRLFVRDHDSAFAAPLGPPMHRRVLDHLLRTEKLPRRFVDRVLAMNEPRLRAELARDPGSRGRPLVLTDRQIEGVMDRRRALLSYVVALVDAYGEARVFSLP
jgi:hypothetical protein